MQIPGVHVETLLPPSRYSDAQLDKALAVAHAMHRGKFILCATPHGPQ